MNQSSDYGRSKFRVRDVEPSPAGTRVHALGGIFTDCSEAYDFLTELRAELESGTDAVVLDLSDVVHMTSGGVGMLAALYSASRDAKRSLVLAGMSERLTAVMNVSRLLPIIPHFATVEEAVAAATSAGSD